jgi:rhamnose transport system ATP-binding protein
LLPQPQAEDEVVLRLHNISKRFGGVAALSDVSLDCRRGEVLALAGENGAGKSTLIKIISGAHAPDAGEINVAGQRFESLSAGRAKALGIAVIYQEFSLLPEMTAAENVFFGKEPTTRLGSVDYAEMERRSASIIGQLSGVDVDVARPVRELSVANQQLVEIARALAEDAQIVVMDEPSAVLAGRDLDGLFGVVRALRDSGRSVIYITHRLEEVFTIADRVTVLKDGRVAGTWPTNQVNRADLIRAMVGRDLGAYPVRQHELGPTVLRVQGLSAGAALRDVSFEVRRGEILGISGLVGSGRSTLATALAGLRPHSGVIEIVGADGTVDRRPRLHATVALVPEDRKTEGLFAEKSVRFNLSLASLSRLTNRGVVNRQAERELVHQWIERLSIRPPDSSRDVDKLSGGNQQKTLLARWLATEPAVLVVDEPTRGVDVGAKAEIYALLRTLTASGTGVVMISSELPELLGMSERVLVLHDGKPMGVLDAAQATEEALMTLAVGQAVPA